MTIFSPPNPAVTNLPLSRCLRDLYLLLGRLYCTPFPRGRRYALAILTLGFLTGCAHHLTGDIVRLDVRPRLQQADRDCGPTALAMLLDFFSYPFQYHDVVPVMTPGRGTLPVAIIRWLDDHGIAHTPVNSPQALHSTLTQGRPVLILLNLGHGPIKRFHYGLVTGFITNARNQVIAFLTYEGQTRMRRRAREDFMAAWSRAGTWGITLVRHHTHKISPVDPLPRHASPVVSRP